MSINIGNRCLPWSKKKEGKSYGECEQEKQESKIVRKEYFPQKKERGRKKETKKKPETNKPDSVLHITVAINITQGWISLMGK